MATNKVSGLRGWTDIGSDSSWDEYGGKWARRAADGSYYVLDFTNVHEVTGEEEGTKYVCEVKRVDLSDLDDKAIASALACVGLERQGCCLRGACVIVPEKTVLTSREDSRIIASRHDSEHPERYELVLVEACVSYGHAQPLDSSSGNTRPANVRANARRIAESLMRDMVKLESALDRPVNRIGSTAREYGRGDINAALFRGPVDTTKAIML